MKVFKVFVIMLLAFVMLGSNLAQAQTEPKKGWSKKAKGAAIGGGTGAVAGAVLGGGKGAVIGAAAAAVGGGIIGRNKDKKSDPVRYQHYAKK